MDKEKKIAALMRGLRSSPTMKWGDEPINESDLLETLHGDVQFWENFDELVDREPHRLERVMYPSLWPRYIEASREDQRAWKLLQAVVRRFQTGNLSLLHSSKVLGHGWQRDTAEPLIEWAIDVAAGVRPMPKLKPPKEIVRDTLMADAVSAIHDVSGRDYESKKDAQAYKKYGKAYEPISACGVVGKKVGKDYETVRKAWQRYKPDHLRRKRVG